MAAVGRREQRQVLARCSRVIDAPDALLLEAHQSRAVGTPDGLAGVPRARRGDGAQRQLARARAGRGAGAKVERCAARTIRDGPRRPEAQADERRQRGRPGKHSAVLRAAPRPLPNRAMTSSNHFPTRSCSRSRHWLAALCWNSLCARIVSIAVLACARACARPASPADSTSSPMLVSRRTSDRASGRPSAWLRGRRSQARDQPLRADVDALVAVDDDPCLRELSRRWPAHLPHLRARQSPH